MLFFYKSHTPIFSYTGHLKKIYNAVKCAIPTPILKKGVQWKKYLKNKKAIGETDNSKKRAVSFASFAGSLTVEAALVLPIFLSAMLLLSGLFHAMSVCSQVNHYLCMTGRKIAAYSRSEKGVDQGTLYQLFYSEIGGSGIDSDDIAGGYAGLIPRAESSEQGHLLKLSIRFGIRMPGYLLPSRTIWTVETVYIRPWTGKSAEMYSGAGEYGQSGQVYVAENGSVYHRDLSCTYLALSIHACSMSSVQHLRNQYGARYVQCERCGHVSDKNQTVFITDMGTAWHTDRHCSGLKRTMDGMSQKEAEQSGLRPCSRCGMSGGGDA